jgi:hypothetical protein
MGVLAEVPHVALGVLGEPVEGVLLGLSVDFDHVVHHPGGHPHHDLGVGGDLHDVALLAVGGDALVDESGAGHEGVVRVVDGGGEPRRLDHGRIGGLDRPW